MTNILSGRDKLSDTEIRNLGHSPYYYRLSLDLEAFHSEGKTPECFGNIIKLYEDKYQLQHYRGEDIAIKSHLAEYKIVIDDLICSSVIPQLAFLADLKEEVLLNFAKWTLYKPVLKDANIIFESRNIFSGPHAASLLSMCEKRKKWLLPLSSFLFVKAGKCKSGESDKYHSILVDVCRNAGVNFHPLTSTSLLETELLQKLWDLPFDAIEIEDVNQISIEKVLSLKILDKAVGPDLSIIFPCVLTCVYYRMKYGQEYKQ